MHDYAWRTEAGCDHDHFLYARLLPLTAEDTRRIPHALETLDSLTLIVLLRFNSLFPESTGIYLSPVLAFSAAEMAHYGGIYQHHFTLTVEAKPGNELFNSTKGQERIGHRHRFRILHLGGGGNQMLDVSLPMSDSGS
jgi:hypothetical protein